MVERLHPGVYVEERRRGVAPITGVSTSTYGTVGFTLRGPVDEAVLVSSFEQFQRIFGGFTDQSGVPLHLFAFFANGGRRAYVVRVVAADAVAADGFIGNPLTEEIAEAIDTTEQVWQIDDPAGAPVFVDETADFRSAGAGDVDPWPAVEAIGDQFAVGFGEQFTQLTIAIGTSGVGGTLTWKYWDGAAWVALAGVVDNTTGFTAAPGVHTVSWTLPADWAPRSLNGGPALYYVVAEVATLYAPNPVLDQGFINNWVVGGTLAHLPVRPGTVSFTYQEPGAAVTLQALNTTTSPALDGATLDFAGRIVVAGNAAIVPGSVTIRWSYVGPTVETFTDPAKDGVLKDAGGNTRGYVNYKTGHFSLSGEVAQAPILAEPFNCDYTPVGPTRTIVDDGAGALTGATLAAAGTINYTTGVYSFVIAAASQLGPHDASSVLVAYTQNAFDIDPISAGAWGDDVSVQVRGNEGAFDRVTAQYTRYDLQVLLEGEVQETFSDLSFTDPTDNDYVITALNDPTQGSDLIELVDPANEAVGPELLSGKARVRGAGSGNGVAQNFGSTAAADPDGYPEIPVAFRSVALETPVQPGSVSIAYTDNTGTARVITDDGNGNLIGAVDPGAPAGFNRVNYTSGKFAFRTVAPVSVAETSNLVAPTGPVPGSIVLLTHRKTPSITATEDDLEGGSDGVAGITRAELTSPALKTDRRGMYALLTSDELLNVGIPDAAGDVTMAGDQIAEAEANQKWFIILASPPGMTPQQVRDWRRFTLGISSSYGALYYPYIRVTDPFTERGANIPPIGHIAGVYARTDTNKNVSKAPAGTEDGRLLFSEGLERRLEFAEIDTFFQSQVNALMDTPQTGRVVWGARTLENPPDDFRYVQVRRLFNFLKSSIYNSTHGFVFENVGASLRQRIQVSVESFLRNLFNQGYFAGSTFTDAVVVICDESNNTADNEEAGEVICDIYIAPNKPGEFIVFRIQQKFSSAG